METKECIGYAILALNYMIEKNPESYSFPVAKEKAFRELEKNMEGYIGSIEPSEAVTISNKLSNGG